MENDTRQTKNDATGALAALAADRTALAENVRVPRAHLAGFGGVAAWWVSSAVGTTPGEDYQAPDSTWLAVVAVFLLSHLVSRETGIRFTSMGAGAWAAGAGILAGCLALFSISLGFVSFGLHWAVILTSLAAFALTTWLAHVAYSSAAKRLRRE